MDTVLDEDVWALIGLFACLTHDNNRKPDFARLAENEWLLMDVLKLHFKTCREPAWSWYDQWIDHNESAASLLLSGVG